MKRRKHKNGNARAGALLGALLPLAMGGHAVAQTGPESEANTVVVTGFRASLQNSIALKKESDNIVDVIKSEDIGKFPDNNLAEAMQRIPGVAIDRDGGEGKSITVRGLNGVFTRTKLNDMEALATAGGREGINRERGFDFNVFAAELFSSVKVSKTNSAESEEGSLGATVDLTIPRPFDYKGFALGASVSGQYNDLSNKGNHRETFMVSNRSDDKRWGGIFSIAHSTNNRIEEGPSSGRWENGAASTFAGAPTGQSSALRFKNYSTDGGLTFIPIPRAATNTANAGTLADLSGEALDITKALHPRIPRYGHVVYEVERTGVTGTLQFRPFKGTLLTLDGLHSDFTSNRNEQYLEVISLSRAGAGTPETGIYNYAINDKGAIERASFNNVDVRSENRHDELKSTFNQLDLTLDQKITGSLQMKAYLGASTSRQDNPEQTTLTLEAYDVQNYSYDYAKRLAPVFNYGKSNGCTVDQTCYWTISSSAAKGDVSLMRMNPNSVSNKFTTKKLDFAYDLTPSTTLKFGLNQKNFTFNLKNARPVSDNMPANAAAYLNANLANFIMPQTMGSGSGSQTWLVPDFNAIKSAFNFGCNCVMPAFAGVLPATPNDFTVSNATPAARAGNQDASEVDKGVYAQIDFSHNVFGIPVRGNTGVRYVRTFESTSAFLQLPASGGITPAPKYVTATQAYSDTLPSLNLNAEPVKNVITRFAASRVMARPSLAALSPNGSINFNNHSFSGGNPGLDPIRGSTYDLNLEWYKDKDSLYSIGYFFKRLKSYPQRTAHIETYGALGLDPELGAANGVTADTPFTVNNFTNTPGGLIRGFEINLQQRFNFLPAPFNNMGGVFNYTRVESKMKYLLSTTSSAVTQADLLGMSPSSINATLYYETDKFSARVSSAYRSKYQTALVPGSNAAFQGKNSTMNVDAQISYNFTPNLTLTLQALNLTDQYNDVFNSYDTAYGNVDNNVPNDAMHSGRSYLIGLRLKY